MTKEPDEEITEAMDDCWQYFLPRVDPLALWAMEHIGTTHRESQVFSILYRSGKIAGETFAIIAPDIEEPLKLLQVMITKLRRKLEIAGNDFEVVTRYKYYRMTKNIRLDMKELNQRYNFRRPDQTNLPWTPEDDDNLIWMLGQKTPTWIAMASLGRSERAIIGRITELGLTEQGARRLPATF